MAAGVSGSRSHNWPADIEIVVTLVRKTHLYRFVYTATETPVQHTADIPSSFSEGNPSMTVGASITSDLQI